MHEARRSLKCLLHFINCQWLKVRITSFIELLSLVIFRDVLLPNPPKKYVKIDHNQNYRDLLSQALYECWQGKIFVVIKALIFSNNCLNNSIFSNVCLNSRRIIISPYKIKIYFNVRYFLVFQHLITVSWMTTNFLVFVTVY